VSFPKEGGGWRDPFWGPWGAAATSIKSFYFMSCQPDIVAIAVGVWYGALTMFAGLAKPVTWAPSLGEGRPGIPHGGRKGGRNRVKGKPKAKFKPVWNLPAETEFELENGLKMAVFKLGSLALEVGYIIFLADLMRDSWIVGTSAAFKYAGCIPSMWGPAEGTLLSFPVGPGTGGYLPWDPTYDPTHLLDVTGWSVPAGVSLHASYSIDVAEWNVTGPPVGNVSISIFDVSAGVIVEGCGAGRSEDAPPGPYTLGGDFTLPVSGDLRRYILLYHCENGYAQLEGSKLYINDALALAGSLIADP
jgi:hypothetical protein